MIMRLGVSLTFALFLLAACSLSSSSISCANTQIDWVNFIEVGSTQYVAGMSSPAPALQTSDLGPVYAHVKFRVSDHVCDPHYRPRDGDAAFLEIGTSIYQVQGHSPTTALAARFNGQIVLYEAMPPSA